MKKIKLKDYRFKCIRFGRPDWDGFTGEMEVSTLDGIYIKSQKYCSTHDRENEYSKSTCKKELIEFITKYQEEIQKDILRLRLHR